MQAFLLCFTGNHGRLTTGMLHREWPNSWSATRYRFTASDTERLLAHLHKTLRELLSMGGLKETKEIERDHASPMSGLAGARQQKVGKVYEYICCRVILMSARPCQSLLHDSMTVSPRGKTKERVLTLSSGPKNKNKTIGLHIDMQRKITHQRIR